jgi:hypothetical protein
MNGIVKAITQGPVCCLMAASEYILDTLITAQSKQSVHLPKANLPIICHSAKEQNTIIV